MPFMLTAFDRIINPLFPVVKAERRRNETNPLVSMRCFRRSQDRFIAGRLISERGPLLSSGELRLAPGRLAMRCRGVTVPANPQSCILRPTHRGVLTHFQNIDGCNPPLKQRGSWIFPTGIGFPLCSTSF